MRSTLALLTYEIAGLVALVVLDGTKVMFITLFGILSIVFITNLAGFATQWRDNNPEKPKITTPTTIMLNLGAKLAWRFQKR